MIKEKDFVQRLNLLKMSKNFVLHEIGDQGEAEVMTISKVPSGDGVYWVAGDTTLKNGKSLESVFRIDTDSGGSVLGVYWFIGNAWFDQQDDDTLNGLKLSKEDVFPYDWKYSLPLEEDIYHS